MIEFCEKGVNLFTNGNCFITFTIVYFLMSSLLITIAYIMRWLFAVKESEKEQ